MDDTSHYQIRNASSYRGEREWKGQCPFCDSSRMLVHPVNITYRQHTITDFSDLPDAIRERYYNLPNIVQAVMIAIDDPRASIITECMDCGETMTGFWNERPDASGVNTALPNKQKLQKYLMDLYGVSTIMKLGLDENGRERGY